MTERNYAIDFIRLVAIIGVVLIHVSTAFTDRTNYFSFDFYFIHFLNQAARFSVPLFFGISGYLLASRYSEIKGVLTFYKKRLSRILIPYIIWSVIYFLFIFPNPFSQIFSLKFVDELLKGDASYQLYFIPTIFVLYLVFPLLIKNKKVFLTYWFTIFTIFLTTGLLSYSFTTHNNLPIFEPVKYAIFNFLPFLVGIFAATKKYDLKKITKNYFSILFASFVFLILFIFFESIYFLKKTNLDFYVRDQWRITVMIYGIVAGGFFYYLFEKFLTKYKNEISYLSRFSFGIFFVHVAILHFLLDIIDKNEFFGVIPFVITFTAVTFLSLSFSIIFSKIKFVNKLLGLKG